MPDFDPDGQFWIIPAQPGPPPPEAIGTAGPLSAIWRAFDREEHDRAMTADREALASARQALDTDRRDWEREKAGVIQRFGDGIARMSRRMDALVQSRHDRHTLDALSEVTEEQLRLPEDAVDPDAADSGEATILAPPHDPDEEPEEYTGDQGALPEPYQRGAPPETGDMPTPTLAQLVHPNPAPPTPTAIGGN